jgi:hypothetical protein
MNVATPVEWTSRDGEQSRAVYPNEQGYAERDGQKLFLRGLRRG